METIGDFEDMLGLLNLNQEAAGKPLRRAEPNSFRKA